MFASILPEFSDLTTTTTAFARHVTSVVLPTEYCGSYGTSPKLQGDRLPHFAVRAAPSENPV